MKQTKTELCGRSTSILKRLNSQNEYYYKRYTCKNIECETCSKVIKNKLINQINYYTNEYNLNRFFTLTTTKENKELSRTWEKIRKSIEELNKEVFIKRRMSRNKYDKEKAEEAYNKHIERIIEYELNCYYLFEYEGNRYRNYNNIGIRITNLIINNELEKSKEIKLLPKNGSGYRARKKMINNQEKYRKKFKDMNPKEKFNFFNDYKELFFVMIDTGKDNVERRRKLIKERVLKNTDKHKFEYVWFLEFQKNGAPHIHVLSNYYFNYYSIHSAWTEDTNITKDINLENWENNSYKSDRIAKYVTKYLTKDTLETQKKLKDLGQNINIMGSSNNIKVNLDYPTYEIEEEEKMDFQHIELLKYKIPPSSFGKIENPIQQFKDELKSDEALKKNEHLQLIHDKFKSTEKEIEEHAKRSLEKEKSINRSLLKERRKFKQEKWEEFNEFKNIESAKLIAKELTKRNKTIKIQKLKEISNNIDPLQKEFIEAVLNDNYNIILLKGKAGTGKSTSIKFLLDTIDDKNLKIEVVSFTGKASAVIGNITKLEGKTIHRLAEAKYNNLPDFTHGENNLIEADIIIVDEISMCDLMTFASFLNSIKPETKIILIGDKNQLNPIKSNNIITLLEEVKLNNVKSIELEKNYRSQDKINKLAMQVLEKKADKLNYINYDKEKIKELILNGYQILSNTNNIRHEINSSISEMKKDIRIGIYTYNINDKVMVVKNDKTKEVFNGDILEIIKYDEEYIYLRNIKNKKEIKYNFIDANASIEPSNCITIHKSQGSEYEKVGIVLENKTLLLTNNLLYTAITRAKSEVMIFITDEKMDTNLLNHKAPEPYEISLKNFL